MDPTLERLNMIFEEKRLASFKHWPFNEENVCTVKKMAEAGFFWNGTKEEPDSAQCFVCNKVLDGWEAIDDPWVEHKTHAENCPFVVIGKREDDLLLEQFYDLWRAMARNLGDLIIKNHEKKILAHVQHVRDIIVAYSNEKTVN